MQSSPLKQHCLSYHNLSHNAACMTQYSKNIKFWLLLASKLPCNSKK